MDDLVLRDRDTTGGGSLNERLYGLQDANWNVIVLADTTATAQERYLYSPFGAMTFLNGSMSSVLPQSSINSQILFTGQRLDSDSGLWLFRNRVFDSNSGRFASRDTMLYSNEPSAYAAWFILNGVDALGTVSVTVNNHMVPVYRGNVSWPNPTNPGWIYYPLTPLPDGRTRLGYTDTTVLFICSCVPRGALTGLPAAIAALGGSNSTCYELQCEATLTTSILIQENAQLRGTTTIQEIYGHEQRHTDSFTSGFYAIVNDILSVAEARTYGCCGTGQSKCLDTAIQARADAYRRFREYVANDHTANPRGPRAGAPYPPFGIMPPEGLTP